MARGFVKKMIAVVLAVLFFLAVIHAFLQIYMYRTVTEYESSIMLDQLEELTGDLDYKGAFDLMPSLPGITAFAANHDSGEIIGSTNPDHVGKTLDELGIAVNGFHEDGVLYDVKPGGVPSVCQFRVHGEYCFGIITAKQTMYSSLPGNIAIIAVYLAVAGVALILSIWYFSLREIRSEKRSHALTEAIGYGYSSYQVIDINTEEILEYDVEDEEVRPLVEHLIASGSYTAAITKLYAPLLAANREEVLALLDIENVREQLKKNKQYTVPHVRRTDHGEEHVQFTFSRIGEDYGKDAFAIITRNVHTAVLKELKQQRELEEALKRAQVASQAKSDFLFNMSHDIRTPMNAVLGFAALAGKYIDDRERALDCLSKLERAGGHLQRLINNVLDMSRIESGRLKLKPNPHSIRRAMSDVHSIFEGEMAKSGVTFTVECRTEREYFSYDRLALEQIELNLLSNAMKYTPAGGSVSYTVTESPSEKEGCSVLTFTVLDSGIGMSEEFLGKLFAEFEREHGGYSDEVQGVGLGLAITKRLVDAMGGRIECRSKKGEGTCFTITLTLPHAEAPENTARESVNDTRAFDGMRLLLVEDNELNREIATELLEDLGFAVDGTESGENAIRILESDHGYDALLTDIQMPGMDGYETARRIRSSDDPYMKELPIIALTANAFDEDRQKALDSGMNEHLPKPISAKRLRQVLGEVIISKKKGD